MPAPAPMNDNPRLIRKAEIGFVAIANVDLLVDTQTILLPATLIPGQIFIPFEQSARVRVTQVSGGVPNGTATVAIGNNGSFDNIAQASTIANMAVGDLNNLTPKAVPVSVAIDAVDIVMDVKGDSGTATTYTGTCYLWGLIIDT